MTRYLFDTGIAGDYVHCRHSILEKAQAEVLKGHRVGICIPVLGELCAGIENSSSRDRNMKELMRAVSKLALWPFDQNAAEEYGRIYVKQRQIGRLIGAIDMQIAAIALTLNCIVVSKDSDLAAIPRLRVENWAV
jgi:tRNA(fMet)-specific endonuclease VapC